jgi:hypothetical protein
MTAPEVLIAECRARGIILEVEGDKLRCRARMGVATQGLKDAIAAHKPKLLQLLTAPEADVLSEAPCPICSSHECWHWLDGRLLCRVCVMLDLAPLTLVPEG